MNIQVAAVGWRRRRSRGRKGIVRVHLQGWCGCCRRAIEAEVEERRAHLDAYKLAELWFGSALLLVSARIVVCGRSCWRPTFASELLYAISHDTRCPICGNAVRCLHAMYIWKMQSPFDDVHDAAHYVSLDEEYVAEELKGRACPREGRRMRQQARKIRLREKRLLSSPGSQLPS